MYIPLADVLHEAEELAQPFRPGHFPDEVRTLQTPIHAYIHTYLTDQHTYAHTYIATFGELLRRHLVSDVEVLGPHPCDTHRDTHGHRNSGQIWPAAVRCGADRARCR